MILAFLLFAGPFCPPDPILTLDVELQCSSPTCAQTLQLCEDLEEGESYCSCKVQGDTVVMECWGCTREGEMCPGGGRLCTLNLGPDKSHPIPTCGCEPL